MATLAELQERLATVNEALASPISRVGTTGPDGHAKDVGYRSAGDLLNMKSWLEREINELQGQTVPRRLFAVSQKGL